MKTNIKTALKRAYSKGNRTFEGLAKFLQVNFPTSLKNEDYELITELLISKR